ncbi:MAG: PorT family protein [Saprospiraceae bacterium]|nr:PorT family protein [Saprospiraceae bacterium]
MKNIVIVLLIIFKTTICLQSQATTENSGFGFGIRAGVNFQNINGKNAIDNTLKNDLLIGFHGGLTLDIPIAPEFYFQTGLLYSTKGAKNNEEILGQPIKSTISIGYLELPLNFLYKPALGMGHLLLGFGPYVGYGINGSLKYDGNLSSLNGDIKFQNKVNITDPINTTYLKPLDFGANILIGYEFSNKISFQLNAQLGLTKINPEYEGSVNDKTAIKNTGFGLSLGYRLR